MDGRTDGWMNGWLRPDFDKQSSLSLVIAPLSRQRAGRRRRVFEIGGLSFLGEVQ